MLLAMIVILMEDDTFGPSLDLCVGFLFLQYPLVSGEIFLGVELSGVCNSRLLLCHCVRR